ncbi:MAG: hypothetical protein K2H29_09435 [Oscillospiraceae bacterium]|nr:hypothetical protein [Oscillospiraceae bacterium]MDE5885278.1 hypothetical protein [Oscillospiraceae bacterium]
MGLRDLFKKKTYYFNKKITPQCAYCAYGKRTRDGGRILCTKQGLMEENAFCGKFLYDPLNRIPVKQLRIEGALTEEELYRELPPEILEALELPELPDDMKAPEITDALKAPELPDAMKNMEVMEILGRIETPETPALSDLPQVPSVTDISDIPDIQEIQEIPDIPEVPDFTGGEN